VRASLGRLVRYTHAQLAARAITNTCFHSEVDAAMATHDTESDPSEDMRKQLLENPIPIPTDGSSDEQDPRLKTPTKASLKRFEFVPRGDLSGYQIPKLTPGASASATPDDDGEGSSNVDQSEMTSTSKATESPKQRMNLKVPKWHPANPNFPFATPGPSPSYQNYWNQSWAPEAAYSVYWGRHPSREEYESYDYYGQGYYEEEPEEELMDDSGPASSSTWHRYPQPEASTSQPSQPSSKPSTVTEDMIIGETITLQGFLQFSRNQAFSRRFINIQALFISVRTMQLIV
jgi:hypothetical protein